MSEQKLLVIGAGIGQVPLVEAAKRHGVHVTVVSRPGDYPCFALADTSCPLDIYDRDAIVEYARVNGITAVASDQNDLMMPTVAYVAEKLGLPGNSFAKVWTYCNKTNFRALCERAGTPVPRHVSLTGLSIPNQFRDIPLPWIVKPEDSQSSIGVTKISTLDEFEPAVRLALEKSRSGRAILEEFFVGREVVCEGFAYKGRCYHLSLGDRRYFDLPNLLIPSQTLFPSLLPREFQDRIVAYEQRNTAEGGLNFAILHSEYLVNEETGEIRIVETAPRGGGVYISSHLIPAATGVDVTDLILRLSLGENVDVDSLFAQRVQRSSGYVCFCLPEGVVASIDGRDRVKANPNVIKAYLDDIAPGLKTRPMLYKGARRGPILVKAENRAALEDVICEVQKTLKIEVAVTSGQSQSICWQ